jgi:hypothetical protein
MASTFTVVMSAVPRSMSIASELIARAVFCLPVRRYAESPLFCG